MRRFVGAAFALAAMFLSVPIAPVHAGDDCSDPTDIALNAVVDGSTVGNDSDGSAICGVSSGSPDAWFVVRPETDGLLTAQTCGSDFDTVLSFHASCPGETGEALSCNDDACSVQSRLTTAVTGGEDVLIRVSGYDGDSGSFTLAVSFRDGELGLDCDAVQEVQLGETVEGNTTDVTPSGTAACGDSQSAPDIWFRHTATKKCLLVGSTCDAATNYDTVLSVHAQCDPNSAVLSCNDDACDLQSRVQVSAEPGQTYWFRVAGYGGDAGRFRFSLECRELPEGDADMVITDLDEMRQVGRLGETVALSMRSTICNIGGLAIDWQANPSPNHPVLVFNAFRLQDGRFEQIGQSWAKHGFAASQSDGLCEGACLPDDAGGLGPGCADIYGVSTNAAQGTFGPRREIDAFTGAFTWLGSHIQVNGDHGHDPIEHRLQVRDADIDPAQNDGARYMVELYVLSHDDADHSNSMGWKHFRPSGRPGGTWNFALEQNLAVQEPIFAAWPDSSMSEIGGGEDSGDGRAWLGWKVTENGDGTWHYEYALYNVDMERAIGSFSVPVAGGVSVENIEFHAVRSHDDGFSNDPWIAERTANAVEWRVQSSDAAGALAPNTLRWSTMYTFRFDAAAPPSPSLATIEPFEGDPEAAFSGDTEAPAGIGFRRGDPNASGGLDVSDAITVLGFLFRGTEAPSCLDAADADDNGVVEITDAIYGLAWLFTGGPAPPSPGAIQCGSDPTPDEFPDCKYDACGL